MARRHTPLVEWPCAWTLLASVDRILDIATRCLRTCAAEGCHQTLALMHREVYPVGQQCQIYLGAEWIAQARAACTVSDLSPVVRLSR